MSNNVFFMIVDSFGRQRYSTWRLYIHIYIATTYEFYLISSNRLARDLPISGHGKLKITAQIMMHNTSEFGNETMVVAIVAIIIIAHLFSL